MIKPIKFTLSIKILGGERDYSLGTMQVAEFEREPSIDDAVGAWGSMARNAIKMTHRSMAYAYVADRFVHEGSIGAEIGVDKGDGLLLWLHQNPGHIYAVDPWVTHEWDEWFKDSPETLERRYDNVVFKFSEVDVVEICRMTSDTWFNQQPRDTLDWCFVDGDHREDAAYRDLCNAHRVVKNGGYIFVDDVQCHKWHDEVSRALTRFKGSGYGYKVRYDTTDPTVLEVVK